MAQKPLKIGVVGTGPAALMAADVLASAKHSVVIFERSRGAGRKLLIAGSSGLNISNGLALDDFIQAMTPSLDFIDHPLRHFPPAAWLAFLEQSLGLETFLGTSNRYFVREMKAANLVRAWSERLRNLGVEFRFQQELSSFEPLNDEVRLRFARGDSQVFDAAVLALGGGSYLPKDEPLRWPDEFQKLGIASEPFTPRNVGYGVEWKGMFLEEADRTPLKNIRLTTAKGQQLGELLITSYGLEGTPIYAFGTPGMAYLDLKPDLDRSSLRKKLSAGTENLSPLRRAKKNLRLSSSLQALLFHHAPPEALQELDTFIELLKNFPLLLGEPQPLRDAISSSGGIHLSELAPNFSLKKYPRVFLAGEMLNWDAPTGGFLIQTCVSQGRAAAQGVLGLR